MILSNYIPLKDSVNEEEDKLLLEVSAAKSGVIGNGPVFSPLILCQM